MSFADFWNRIQRLKYMHDWRKAHSDKVLLWNKVHNRDRKHVCAYVGVCVCPRCGKRGYKFHTTQRHKITGKEWICTHVEHQHSHLGRTIYDGVCYVGIGKQ